jgi:hypothetical protein
MKLHANAKLGPKGRLVMCRRVVEQRWSIAEAALAENYGSSRPAFTDAPALARALGWEAMGPVLSAKAEERPSDER